MSKRMKRIVYIVCGLAIAVALSDPYGRYLEATGCSCDSITASGTGTLVTLDDRVKIYPHDSGDLIFSVRNSGDAEKFRVGPNNVFVLDDNLRVNCSATNAVDIRQADDPNTMALTVDTQNYAVRLWHGTRIVQQSESYPLKLNSFQDVIITLGADM